MVAIGICNENLSVLIASHKLYNLLDDIFDKLDAQRVEQIVKLVAGDEYGQIFITDTNRDHLDLILSRSSLDYKIFHVDNGEIEEIKKDV